MHRFQVRPLSLPEEGARFVETWWRIYDGQPGWAPPLRRAALRLLDPAHNPYFQRAEVEVFAAFKDGEPAGTISVQVDRDLQRAEPGVGFFGSYEFVDDEAVARCLLATASSWLREKGMLRVRGPFNLSPGQGFGLLVDGFSCSACLLDPQALEYYPRMYERLGLVPVSTWRSWWVDAGPIPARLAALDAAVRRRHPDLVVRPLDLDRFDQEVEALAGLADAAEGPSRLTASDLRDLLARVRPMVEPRLVWMAELSGRLVAATVSVPDLNPLLRRMRGRMLPFGWFHWWFGRNRVDAVRAVAYLARRGYGASGLSAPLMAATWQSALSLGAKGFEVPPLPADSRQSLHALEDAGARPFRTYRLYERDLEADATEECPLPGCG